MSMPKIMVADDDKNICELLRLYLERRATPSPWPTTGRPPWSSSRPIPRTWSCWIS